MSKSGSAVDCLNEYLPYWKARGFSLSDVYIISHFLFSNGAYKEIIRFNIECLEKDDPVAWQYLVKVLRLVEPNLKSAIYKTLKDYIEDNRKLDEFSNCDLFDALFPNELEVKNQQIQRRLQIKERHRHTLLDQIRVFNQSRNFNIEKQSILKYLKFFPQDKLGKEMLERYEFEDLQRFFNRYQNEKLNEDKSKRIYPRFNEPEKKQLDEYFNYAQTKNSDEIECFVYFFIFLEDYSHALDLIPRMNPSEAKDWLHLEILLLNRKFASALAYIHEHLELTYQSKSFYYSAKIYYVSQCLWGLGEEKKAINLITNLIQVHPEYRLANTLLKEWKSAV